MMFSSIFLASLLETVFSQGTGTVNTATVTDATAPVQTPSTLASISSRPVSRPILQTVLQNPVAATAPGAVIASTPNDATIATSSLTTNIVQPTVIAAVAAQDLFLPIASDNPANVLRGSYSHPQPPAQIALAYQGANGLPVATNNFWSNLVSTDPTTPIFPMPYTLYWRRGAGMCAWNTDSSKYVFGSYSEESTPGPHYYFSPGGNCPIGFSSAEMDSNQQMVVSNMQHQSADVTFSPSSNAGSMKMPIVQGSAFLTSIYTNLQPTLFGGAFTSLAPVTFKAGSITAGLSKYRVTINNGDTWLVYVFASNGGSSTFSLSSSTLLVGPAGFNGVVQIAKLPAGFSPSDEAVYDAAAGTYATQNVLSGSAVANVGSYTFDFRPVSLAGNALLSFLFPHQQSSVSSGSATSLKLWSNTKGLMKAYYGNALSFSENNLPTDIQFLPWSPLGNLQNYSASALKAIATAANAEAAQVMSQQTNLDSMYFSGKALAKFAQVCLVINDVLQADARSCVAELEQSLNTFVNNNNIYPLVYDTAWKGAISSCGNSGCDFGNAWYNDHHFHYGYFVYTAAVVAHIDPTWLTATHKAYINTLIRDFANPSTADTAFPQFRNFDWYAGHSWAHGIIPAGDGKDEESSSEDYNAIYGMKLWGKVIGDNSMEARGNLMLSVMRRSMQSYMLMSQDNTIQPASFVPQYAAGITFMNKIDHSTYFGRLEQYIQGIHMIPLTPISAFIRTPTFVAQEWAAVITPTLNSVQDGWRGILYANLAISNSTAAYNFFSSSSFSNAYLDGGASLTWYLTYAAGLGGAGNFQLAVGSNNGQVTTQTVTKGATTAVTGTTLVLGDTTTTTSPVATTSSSSFTDQSSSASSSSTSSVSISVPIATTSVGTSGTLPISISLTSPSVDTSLPSASTNSISMSSVDPTSILPSLSASLPLSFPTTSIPDLPSTSPTQSQSITASPLLGSQSLSIPVIPSSISATNILPSGTFSTPSLTVALPVNTGVLIVPGGSVQTVDAQSFILSLADGIHIYYADGVLKVGSASSPLTVFSNGTMAVGNLIAYLVPHSTGIYDIVLLLNAPSSFVRSTWSFSNNKLSLTALLTSLSKRQTTTSTPMTLVYGSDNVVRAVAPINAVASSANALTTSTTLVSVSSNMTTSGSLISGTSSATNLIPTSAFTSTALTSRSAQDPASTSSLSFSTNGGAAVGAQAVASSSPIVPGVSSAVSVSTLVTIVAAPLGNIAVQPASQQPVIVVNPATGASTLVNPDAVVAGGGSDQGSVQAAPAPSVAIAQAGSASSAAAPAQVGTSSQAILPASTSTSTTIVPANTIPPTTSTTIQVTTLPTITTAPLPPSMNSSPTLLVSWLSMVLVIISALLI